MKKTLIITIGFLFLSVMAGPAQAVLVPSGGFLAPTGAVSPGGTLVTSLTVPFLGVSEFIGGTITQNVLQNDTGMLFEYIVNSTGLRKSLDSSVSRHADEGMGPLALCSRNRQ